LPTALPTALEEKCKTLLVELGIIEPGESFTAQSLTGGVASDIALVNTVGRKLCVKFALAKLKVQAEWFAPVHRNAAEYAWLEVAADVAPESAVGLYGQSRKLHGFAMEYIDGEDAYLWKTALLAEELDRGEAAMVGDLLGRIHAASVRGDFDNGAFQNRDDFHALRIEPYLLYAAQQHEDIAPALEQIAERLYHSEQVLLHGDVSPKNIIFRQSGPIVLDAECATMGDAGFDLSFCLNHLVLKAIHLPDSTQIYLTNAIQLWNAYSPAVSWEPVAALEQRICTLLPALMLGRVDGKSPVEYLVEHERSTTRRIARHFIKSPVGRLSELIQGIANMAKEKTA